MPTTLLTGGTGFVGASILSSLLTLSPPHHVILVVRSQSSGEALLSAHPSWATSQITIVPVPDFTAPSAFDSVFQHHPCINHIIHCAAPLVNDPRATDYIEHFEKPNILGNTSLLSAAHKYGKNVKSIAVTGSVNAVSTFSQDDVKARVFTSDEWLPLDRDDAIKMNNNYINYCVSKKVGEEAIWKFVKEEKPNFWVTVFCPGLIFGPMEQKLNGIDGVNFSMGLVWSILNSEKGNGGVVPNTMANAYVSVPAFW
jgi:nucleoside-diphosphate-sugar epimerase